MKNLTLIILAVALTGCNPGSYGDSKKIDVESISISTLNIYKNDSISGVGEFYHSNSVKADLNLLATQEDIGCDINLLGMYVCTGTTGAQSDSIGDSSYINTEVNGSSKNRAYQPAILFNTNHGVLLFISVHFQAYKRDVAYEQARELVSKIQSYEYDHLIVAGDFNIAKGGCRYPECNPDSYEGNYFKRLKSEMNSIGLNMIGGSAPCWDDLTCTYGETHTLDYIFHSDGLIVDEYAVGKSGEISDHNMISTLMHFK